MAKAVQITEPVVKLTREDGGYSAIYILKDKNEKFRMPGVNDNSPRAWDYGPSLIHEEVSPQMTNTVTYDPNNPNIWKWIGALMEVGWYVVGKEELSKQVPKEVKSYWER
ncbi:hypothetical protein C4565_00620 [Candidatus Parcubacteria bacterium]|nr:MAG: hypothetical protein C4565_00620 [Candidatus Parcubacteria bacterium]